MAFPYRMKFSTNLIRLISEPAMKLSVQIKPISYLRTHAADIAKGFAEDPAPYVITHNGEAKMVVMDIKTYEQDQDRLALLKLIAMGEQSRLEGKGLTEEESRAMLARRRKGAR
jgi:PHD/YefM family antitoxin component YafN of YafNO toxin-antitoxin module